MLMDESKILQELNFYLMLIKSIMFVSLKQKALDLSLLELIPVEVIFMVNEVLIL